jgi:hypothetical protein
MADDVKDIATRQKFVEAWNNTMIDIWQERIYKLGVVDTGALWRSVLKLPVRADGRFYDITLSQTFLEYGLWQDLGTGKEVPIGNSGDIGRAKVRERRRWFSTKYYSSVLRLRDFLADSVGDEFKSIFTNAFSSDLLRKSTKYYSSKG